jgi:hypothetical protein
MEVSQHAASIAKLQEGIQPNGVQPSVREDGLWGKRKHLTE